VFARAQVIIGKTQPVRDICQSFIDAAVIELEPLQEKFSREMQAIIETRLAVELASSQEDIRQPFQEAIGRHFPAWRGINLAPPPVPDAPSPKVVDPTGNLPIFGMVGIVIIILRNVI